MHDAARTRKSHLTIVSPSHGRQFANWSDPLMCADGTSIPSLTLAYETYGKLNTDRSNAILLAHSFSYDTHAASSPSLPKPGWWEALIGPGKTIDTNRYFLICSNVLGGCYGSTGPSSSHPQTGEPYGASFPWITMQDMVAAQRRLLDYLGIERLYAAIGGSMGGMQVLQWAHDYPSLVSRVLALATTGKLSSMHVALNELARKTIVSDPAWHGGNYYGLGYPVRGVAAARMTGASTVTAGRRWSDPLPDGKSQGYRFGLTKSIEDSRLDDEAVSPLDANSYVRLLEAMNRYNLRDADWSAAASLGASAPRFTIITYSSDGFFPPAESRQLQRALHGYGLNVRLHEYETAAGHDAFLTEPSQLITDITAFLNAEGFVHE